jgi:tRNA/tmRNA/rRNA uracil-C5-methylase (TrmA/RlmC/RlmD family)
MKTEDWLPLFLESRNSTPVTLVVDPPRDGMHPKAVKDILSFDSDTIIYVSCNPATLVRDLHILLENDAYLISDVVPVDMFPHTHHIETVVRLTKIKKN